MSFFKKLLGNTSYEPIKPDTTHKEPASIKDRNASACPNCGNIFDKPPKRKTTCSACQKSVYVRTKQLIFNSDLLTEEQMLASDFYDDLIWLGVEVGDYVEMEAQLANKWGFEPKPYDVVWGVSNQFVGNLRIHTPSPSEFLEQAKMVLFSQAMYQAKRGNDPTSYLVGVADYDRQIITGYGLDINEFAIEAKDCCSVCSKEQGKKYSAEFLAENLKNGEILPVKGCTRKLETDLKYSWCTCRLSPIISRD